MDAVTETIQGGTGMIEEKMQDDSISRAEAIRIASGYCHPANIADELRKLPSAQKTGRWTNKSVLYGDDIEEWQTCQCSECGRWDTRPYMYYFDEPNYCSYCGAKRQKGEMND